MELPSLSAVPELSTFNVWCSLTIASPGEVTGGNLDGFCGRATGV